MQHAGFKTNLQLQSNKEVNTAEVFPLKVQVRRNITLDHYIKVAENSSEQHEVCNCLSAYLLLPCRLGMHPTVSKYIALLINYKLLIPFLSKVPVIEVTQHTQIVRIPGCPQPAFILKFSKPIRVSLTCCGCY